MSLGLAFRGIGGALAACLLIVGMAGCGSDRAATGPAEEPSIGPGAGAGGKGPPTLGFNWTPLTRLSPLVLKQGRPPTKHRRVRCHSMRCSTIPTMR